MPPATTRRFPERPTSPSRDARIVPPFVPSQIAPQPEAAIPAEAEQPVVAAEPERAQPEAAGQPETMPFEAIEPESFEGAAEPERPEAAAEPELPEALAEPEPLEATAEAEEELPEAAAAVMEAEEAYAGWGSMSEDEGIVEPAFEADTDAVLQELSDHAADFAQREEFPLEAFIVPEQTQHIPSGLEGHAPAAEREPTPVTSLAERLEKLSHRLRVEDTDAIVRRLAAGDRLDSLLAGLLAGYLAGKSERP